MQIIAGKWDDYIDHWGDAARAFGKPMIVVFGVEMNGDWFPWSGTYYGGNKPIPDRPNEWEGPENFKKAYRHVVDRVRARGAANINGCFTPTIIPTRWTPGISRPAYYPGPDYVDWFGLSVYGQQFKDEPWANIRFAGRLAVRGNVTARSEQTDHDCGMGHGRIPRMAEQRGMDQARARQFQHALSADQSGGLLARALAESDQSYSNLHINSSVESLNAYREGIANPYWLGNLILRVIKN